MNLLARLLVTCLRLLQGLPLGLQAAIGREEPEFTWERTDKAAALKAAAGL